jgi:hypothetical protein
LAVSIQIPPTPPTLFIDALSSAVQLGSAARTLGAVELCPNVLGGGPYGWGDHGDLVHRGAAAGGEIETAARKVRPSIGAR